MPNEPSRDFLFQIARGKINGAFHVNKFGQNANVADGVQEEIWDGSAAYVFPSSATITRVSQTSDQVALRGETVEVQGLDTNWNAVTQTVDLDGTLSTTPVALTTALRRVYRARILSATVADSTVRVHNTAESQDSAVIGTGNQQTLMAMYTVPDNHTAYLTSYYAVVNPGVGNPTSLPIKLWGVDNVNGYAKQIKHTLGLDLDFTAHLQHNFNPYYVFGERSDIYITATPTGAAADVSAGFDLVVIKNDPELT